VERCEARTAAVDPVVLALDQELAVAACPDCPDHVDRLVERVDALPRTQLRPAESGDGIPEGAGAEPELHPPTAQDVERRHAARQHDRRPQRQVRDVRRHTHAGRLRRDHGEKRPGVQEARLVRVVLEGDEVEPDDVGDPGELDHSACLRGDGGDERSEVQLATVVRHGSARPGAETRRHRFGGRERA
jgi:hypothetical protein